MAENKKVTYNPFKREFWTSENLLNKEKFREVKRNYDKGMSEHRAQKEEARNNKNQ